MARAEHPQKRLGVHRAGPDLDIERLMKKTPARGPEPGERQDEVLERHQPSYRAWSSLSTRTDRSSFWRLAEISSPCAAISSRPARAVNRTSPI